jgi:hypothetical protein
MKHLCQGTKCHTYETQSRIRGVKGNKVLRTRTARYDMETVHSDWTMDWEYYFCDERCLQDWLNTHLTNLMSAVGIKKIPQETPIDVKQETKEGWNGQMYIEKQIVVRA